MTKTRVRSGSYDYSAGKMWWRVAQLSSLALAVAPTFVCAATCLPHLFYSSIRNRESHTNLDHDEPWFVPGTKIIDSF
jgi:hypothetical protein